MNYLLVIVFAAMLFHGVVIFLSAGSEFKNKKERLTGLQFLGLWIVIVIICSLIGK